MGVVYQLLSIGKSVHRGSHIDTTVKGLFCVIFAVLIVRDGHIQEIVLRCHNSLLQEVAVQGKAGLAIVGVEAPM